MAFDYTSLRTNVAEKLIRDFGKDATIHIPADDGGDPWNPASGNPTNQPVKLIQTEFDIKDRDGTLVQENDVMFLVSTEGVSVDPSLADTLTSDGITYQVVGVHPLKPGPVTMLSKVHCRK